MYMVYIGVFMSLIGARGSSDRSGKCTLSMLVRISMTVGTQFHLDVVHIYNGRAVQERIPWSRRSACCARSRSVAHKKPHSMLSCYKLRYNVTGGALGEREQTHRNALSRLFCLHSQLYTSLGCRSLCCRILARYASAVVRLGRWES